MRYFLKHFFNMENLHLRRIDDRSIAERINCMKEVQNSIKMQAISFLLLVFMAIGMLFVLGLAYERISFYFAMKNLGNQAMENSIQLTKHLDVEKIMEIVKEPEEHKNDYNVLYEEFNLYASVLNAKYVYIMLKETELTKEYINFSEFANEQSGSSVLSESKNPFRFIVCNTYKDALYIDTFWDDVTDYTKPGPLECIAQKQPVASLLMENHDRWGALTSGQTPLYYKGEIIGFVGVDYTTNHAMENIQKNWRNLSVILLLTASLMLLIRTFLVADMNNKMIQKIVHQKYIHYKDSDNDE